MTLRYPPQPGDTALIDGVVFTVTEYQPSPGYPTPNYVLGRRPTDPLNFTHTCTGDQYQRAAAHNEAIPPLLADYHAKHYGIHIGQVYAPINRPDIYKITGFAGLGLLHTSQRRIVTANQWVAWRDRTARRGKAKAKSG